MLALFSEPAQLLTVFFALPCKCVWIKAGMIGRRLYGASSQNQQQLLQCAGVSVVFLFLWEKQKSWPSHFLQLYPPPPFSVALLESLLNPMTRCFWFFDEDSVRRSVTRWLHFSISQQQKLWLTGIWVASKWLASKIKTLQRCLNDSKKLPLCLPS